MSAPEPTTRSAGASPSSPPRRRPWPGSAVARTAFYVGNVALWLTLLHVEGGFGSWTEVALGTLGYYLGVQGLVCVHELGHLAAAGALGYQLQELRVGQGPPWLRALGGTLELRGGPWINGGWVIATDTREAGWRRRRWLFAAAGPAAQAAGMAVLAGWVGRPDHFPAADLPIPPSDDWIERLSLTRFAGALVLWTSLVLLVNSLWPRRGAVAGRSLLSDGWHLWRVPRYSAAQVRAHLVFGLARRAENLWWRGFRAAARKRLEGAARQYPDEPALVLLRARLLVNERAPAAAVAVLRPWWALHATREHPWSAGDRWQLRLQWIDALAWAGRPDEARTVAQGFLELISGDLRAPALQRFASLTLLRPGHPLRPDADAWSQEAVARAPEVGEACAIRGGVLLEAGRAAEAVPLLRAAWKQCTAVDTAGLCAFFLALHAWRQGPGARQELRRWRARARWFADAADSWELRERIATEIGPGQTALPAQAKTREIDQATELTDSGGRW